MEVEKLDNGITLYKIPNNNARTIGIGIGVEIGSIYENKDMRGISHLLEHMSFKTNYKYSSEQINYGLELNGGISNAFTSETLTGYLLEVLPEGFEKTLDILFTIYNNKKYRLDEFEKEKKVVLSEIERYENDPESYLEINIPKSIYGESDYGDPIGGYRHTIININKEDIERFKEDYYNPDNTFIIIEGNFSDKHIKLVKEYFRKLDGSSKKKKNPSKDIGKDIIIDMDTRNQIYFAINRSYNIDNIYSIDSLSLILSGGISSKIFQIFRNKHGIGYHIKLEIEYTFKDELIFSLVIPGFEKEKEKEVEKAINDLIESYSKIEKEYVEGRILREDFIFKTKIENNIFSRLYRDLYLIHLLNINVDEYHKRLIEFTKQNYSELLEYLVKLFEDGKKVIIYPK